MSKKKKRKTGDSLLVVFSIFAVLVVIVLILMITLAVIIKNGERKLEAGATTEVPVIEFPMKEKPEEPLAEGQIIYKGQKYQYNKDIKSFVIMGIDTMDTVDKLIENPTSGGQSDMNFVAVMNPHKKKIQLIAINRNTMTTIYCYTADGELTRTENAQLTLQHAYGSGGADSCEMMVSAIDNIMYMIPIHGYFAMNMGAIMKLNDAIGGVELTAIQDISQEGVKIKAGDKILLEGKEAFFYTKYRDWKEEGSADKRLERQKQYLFAFVNKVKEMVKADITLPLKLYQIIEDYSVTDISMDKISYLATQLVSYSFDKSDIYSVPGKTKTQHVEFEEFHIDEEGLQDLLVEIFYEPVE